MSESQDKIRVIVSMDFSDDLLERLRAVSDRIQVERHHPDVPASAYKDVEVLYTLRNFPEPEQAPHLRWIQLHFAGLDSMIHRPIAQAEDVEITSASGIHAVPIAEYCMAMMLAWEYKLPKMFEFKQKAHWPENPNTVFRPKTLRDQTLGIVGYGSIGRELARLADQFGMKVLATKRNLLNTTDDDGYAEAGTGDPTGDIPERLYPPEALGTMVKDCDFLVVTVPLTPDTRHLINADILGKMKKSAFLINIARGSVIDEAALISTLAAEKIAGAALDVFEEEPLPSSSPLWNLDNVIISPHVSGNNTRYNERAAALFEENLRRYVEKRPLLNRLERTRGY
jgi:phosphoglycerate dehydrogenase-like enzyme